MLLMVENVIKRRICHSVYIYEEVNNKYMRDHDNKELSCLQCWEVNNLYGWSMSQKLPRNDFVGIKDTSQFNEDFLKSFN